MINNCNHCGKYPKVEEMISCENSECGAFNIPYFIYDWQALGTDKDVDALTLLQEFSVDL